MKVPASVPPGALTPDQVVTALDRYIIGQAAAKRAVAVALRNRLRRLAIDEDFRDEITPRNIILIGPTGCGKTEIARRLARLVDAPFVKVEATRFTEVGYVGRDVESMVRDLVAESIKLVRQEHMARKSEEAQRAAEEKLLDVLLPSPPGRTPSRSSSRDALREQLRSGALDGRTVQLDLPVRGGGIPIFPIHGGGGGAEQGQGMGELLEKLMPKRQHRREVTVKEARSLLMEQELEALVSDAEVADIAIRKAEQEGIIFLDEIDKIAAHEQGRGPDVSREGVQRDILPIVEGSTVQTRWGPVRTDHVLFVAAGAFHVSKPSDLIPELQGRFPVRVELRSLDRDVLRRILTEPDNALTLQYIALMATEGVEIEFTPGALDRVATIAAEVNERTEDIGARRLQTVMEHLMEEISFHSPGWRGARVLVDEAMVEARLSDVIADTDLTRFIL
jgi:ATP-dependent HslUV protease ATP-binding subunit HslU